MHVAFTAAVALLVLVACWSVWDYLPVAQLLIELSMLPYLLCVGLGMILSGRFVQHFAARFHRLSWMNAAWLTTRQIITVAMVLFMFMFAFKDRGMSRVFMSSYLVACWCALLVVNLGLPRMMARLFFDDARKIPTLFVGGLSALGKLKTWLASKQVLGLQPMGFLATDGALNADSAMPFLGELRDLPRRIAEKKAAQVILLELPRTEEQGQFILKACQESGCRLLIYSNLADQLRHPVTTVDEEGHQFYTLQTEPLEDPLNRMLKRTFDIAVALPVVLFLLPPLAFWVWLMQRFQAPGPVLFAQLRTGHSQKPFRCLKFRSMKMDNPDESRQATRDDDRIYAFGHFLRRSSLDEFPQFWNVLMGDMSLVGPRPHMPAHDSQFATFMQSYRTRFFVKPGITGLAQCNGYRGEITDPQMLLKRVQFDLEYINDWSIWMDVQLVAKTAWQVLFPPKSAY